MRNVKSRKWNNIVLFKCIRTVSNQKIHLINMFLFGMHFTWQTRAEREKKTHMYIWFCYITSLISLESLILFAHRKKWKKNRRMKVIVNDQGLILFCLAKRRKRKNTHVREQHWGNVQIMIQMYFEHYCKKTHLSIFLWCLINFYFISRFDENCFVQNHGHRMTLTSSIVRCRKFFQTYTFQMLESNRRSITG